MQALKKIFKQSLSLFEPKAKGKNLIFLSDDWGSFRIKSKKDQAELVNKGLRIENRFDAFDTLESNTDLELLFDVLVKHKNADGKNPVISAVANVGNPDFDKIKATNFQHYFYKSSFDCYRENEPSSKVPELFFEGMKRGIFIPHLHGREHVNVNWWMAELKDEKSFARKFFDNDYFFFNSTYISNPYRNRDFSAAFDVWKAEDISSHHQIAASACSLFEHTFNFKSSLFTPPALFYHTDIESTLVANGVKWIDISRKQLIPLPNGKEKSAFNFQAQKRKSGLRSLLRNAMFEPNMNASDNGVDACLASIAFAFEMGQPAIVSNHRAAFTGGIDEKNREKGLKALDQLFASILKTWPDVNFISAHEMESILK